jgi:hypothetical protein
MYYIDNPKAIQIRRRRLANHARDRHSAYHPPKMIVQEKLCVYTATHNDLHSAWFKIGILPSREVIKTDNYMELKFFITSVRTTAAKCSKLYMR